MKTTVQTKEEERMKKKKSEEEEERGSGDAWRRETVRGSRETKGLAVCEGQREQS